jgi:hypothetical protein
VPLARPTKGKVGTSHQVKLYQAMNALSRPKNSKQLRKSSTKKVAGKHHGVHGSQSFSTTINCLSNMLSTILEEHNSIAMPGVGPKSFDST